MEWKDLKILEVGGGQLGDTAVKECECDSGIKNPPSREVPGPGEIPNLFHNRGVLNETPSRMLAETVDSILPAAENSENNVPEKVGSAGASPSTFGKEALFRLEGESPDEPKFSQRVCR